MAIDSARLYTPVLWINVILGFFHYIVLLSPYFIPVLAIIIPYALVIRSLKDDGKKAIYAPPLVLADVILLTLIGYLDSLPFLIWMVILLFFIMCAMFLVVRREIFYFDRTILSMNIKDRARARRALSTKDPADIAKVAAYHDWGSLD